MSAITRGSTKKFQRRKTHGGEGIDLLGHLHRAELSGECRAGSARHDDARHHGAHLADHGDADQIRHIDLRAELFELHGADERENHADQETDQCDDGQRLSAALLNQEKEIHGAESHLHTKEPEKCKRHLARETPASLRETCRRLWRCCRRVQEKALHSLFARAFFLRHRFGQIE